MSESAAYKAWADEVALDAAGRKDCGAAMKERHRSEVAEMRKRHAAERAEANLPRRQRAALERRKTMLLMHQEGMSIKEIAVVMGASYGRTSTLIGRARAMEESRRAHGS